MKGIYISYKILLTSATLPNYVIPTVTLRIFTELCRGVYLLSHPVLIVICGFFWVDYSFKLDNSEVSNVAKLCNWLTKLHLFRSLMSIDVFIVTLCIDCNLQYTGEGCTFQFKAQMKSATLPNSLIGLMTASPAMLYTHRVPWQFYITSSSFRKL